MHIAYLIYFCLVNSEFDSEFDSFLNFACKQEAVLVGSNADIFKINAYTKSSMIEYQQIFDSLDERSNTCQMQYTKKED